jgi:predicted ATPase
LVESVAATVGARPRAGASIAESLVEYLRTKTMLLVLDNCEHLLNESAELAEAILRSAVAVRVLATSREALAVDGERLVPVRSLGLPPARDLAAAEASDALCLFEARGAAARPGFRLDASNLAASVEICERLDGIPLAIELAAARLAAMSPAEISGHLDERFRLLTGGRRLGVERHQTLRAAVDWSYALLGDEERALFDRLGVFAGSFDALAATAIVAGTGVESWDVLDALSGLVAKTMLGAEETADGTMRYQLLQTLGQYALERLHETGDLDACRRVHAAHYATFAEEIGPKLLGPDELRSRRRLRTELDNLRAAVNWALDSQHDDDVEFAARIVAALAAQASAYRVAGIVAWAQRVLPRADTIRPDLRVGVLAAASWDATMIHIDYPRAIELGYAALDAAENQRDAITSLALGPVCVALLYSGRADEAASVAKHAVSLLDDSPETGFARASMQVVPAMAEIMHGDIAKARHEAQTTLTVARNSRNPSAIALATFELGWALMYQEPDEALRVFDESIQLVRQGAADMIFPHVLARAAVLRAAKGARTALSDLRDAITFSYDFGGQTTMVAVLDYSVRVLASLGHHETGAVIAGFLDTGQIASLFPVDGPERAGREQARENMLDKLGPTAYDEAQSRGAHLTYDGLIDYLLRNLDG